MWNFCNRHPFVSLFMLDVVVTGIVNVVTLIKGESISSDSETDTGTSTDEQ